MRNSSRRGRAAIQRLQLRFPGQLVETISTRSRLASAGYLHLCRSFVSSLGLFVVVCLFSISTANGQYRFDYWTTSEGLPQNSVDAIAQTPDGYLWFTTLDGLVRYDGVRFTVFNKHDASGILSNRFYSMFCDRNGTLWIGTEDSGLIRYEKGKFSTFTTSDGLPSNWVRSIQDAGNGNLLISTQEGIVEWNSSRFIRDPVQESAFIQKVYLSPTGNRWNWDLNGLTERTGDREIHYPVPKETVQHLPSALFEDKSGGLWGGPYNDGLFYVKDGTVRYLNKNDGLPEGPYSVWAIMQDHDGDVWIATGGKGLVRCRNGQFTVYTTSDGLSSNIIKSIFQDRERTIWIGTDNRGIDRMTPQFITTLSKEKGLAGVNVYPILQEGSGPIWIGTTEGLSRLQDGEFTTYGREIGLSDKNMQALAVDHSGALFVGTVGHLYRMENGLFTANTAPELCTGIRSIWEDDSGIMWVGTDKGLVKVQNGKVIRRFTDQDGLPGNDVTVILKDHSGGLWFGMYGGIAQLKDGRFKAYTTADGLASKNVRALHEDSDGTLWIGTYDGGLSRFKNGRFTNYTIDDGLFNNGVFQILEDSRGNFWMSSNRGIYRVSKQQLEDFAEGKITRITCIGYGLQDGMLNTECNGGRWPAGIKDKDGKLWFPTQNGVVVVDPDAVPFNPYPPPVVIESVTVDGASVPINGEIRLLPRQANLEISYAGLSYTKPEQVRFRYMLSGQDATWIDAGTRRVAAYSYLRPGTYTFRVLAANSDSIWNDTGATIRIVVVPAFYQTAWFVALLVAAGCGIAFLLYWYRVTQLRKRHAAREAFSRQLLESQEDFSQRLIESQELERRRMASELHDSLGQNLLIIKNRALLGQTLAQEGQLREQFDEINSSVAEAMSEVRTIAYNLRPLHLERLGLTSTLEEMIEEVSASSGIEISADINPIDGVFPPDAEISVYRIVQECLNNIVKHSEATRAAVTIHKQNSEVLITVEDDGKGFARRAVEEPRKGGLGLTGILERVRMLGGRRSIESAPGKGAKIIIRLPISNRDVGSV